MKKIILALLLCGILSSNAYASEYVYENRAGVQVQFPKEWSINQSADGTTTWYYPKYAFANGDVVGYFIVQKPVDIVTSQDKELFLFNYKVEMLNDSKINNISRFDISGIECEKVSFIRTIEGIDFDGESVIIVNNETAISVSYLKKRDADIGIKDDFENIISSISLEGDDIESYNNEITEIPAEQEYTPTAGERNALSSANNYLKYTSFSKQGLKDQLLFEGYSESESNYAVNTIDVDWNEQAYKSAKNYLEYSSFSYSGLVDQLVFSGFTYDEAEYGANKAYQ